MRFTRSGAFLLGALALSGLVGAQTPATTAVPAVGAAGGYFDSFEDADYQALNAEINGLLGDLPFFYQVPVELMSTDIPPASKAPYFPFRHELSKTGEVNAIGLRFYIMPPDVSREAMSRHLAESGVVKTGDVLLMFRQSTAGQGGYQHIQMGLSHAAVALVRDGYVYNIDSPLDWVSRLNNKHYMEEQLMLHVLRPDYRDGERENLQRWAELLYDNGKKLYTAGKLKFNGDYSAPKYPEEKDAMLLNLGRLIATQGASGEATGMYCSELAWGLAALRTCDLRQFDEGTWPGDCKPDPLFAPLPVLGEVLLDPVDGLPGLSDGIGLVLESLDPPHDQVAELVNKAFAEWTPSFGAAGGPPYTISAGHREQAAKFAPLYEPLKGYFTALQLAPEQAKGIKAALDQEVGSQENYSPTSFMVQALMPKESKHRVMSYVGTIAFPSEDQIKIISQRFPTQLARMVALRPDTLEAATVVSDPSRGLSGSVGRGGVNRPADVLLVQQLLKAKGFDPGPEDGLSGPKLRAAIEEFQQGFMSRPDGRIDVGGGSWRRLAAP